MELSNLTKEQQRIASLLLSGDKNLGAANDEDIKIASQFALERLEKIINPPPLTIKFTDNFNSDEERLSNALPLASAALRSGRLGCEVAGKYFISAFNAAIRLGRYEEAIIATYGMASAMVSPHKYCELIRNHHSGCGDWFTPYEKRTTRKALDFGISPFQSWYQCRAQEYVNSIVSAKE